VPLIFPRADQSHHPGSVHEPEHVGLRADYAGRWTIIVNGQLIGAIGVGGIPPVERTATYGEEMCARDALEGVIGPQPPLLPDLSAQRNLHDAIVRCHAPRLMAGFWVTPKS
jgi:hypothetical protein